MADQRLPELNPVVTPALTDLHYSRQSGDTRDKRQTTAQILSLFVEVNDLTAAVVWADVPQANIPDPLLMALGTVSAPPYSFAGDPDTGVFSGGADTVSLTAGGVEIGRAAEGGIADQFIVTPGLIQDVSILPALAVGEANKGFYSPIAGTLRVATPGGGGVFEWTNLNYQGVAANSPALRSTAATATVPNVHPNKGDLDTGIGSAGADILSLIAGGKEAIRFTEVSNAVLQAPNAIHNSSAFSGGGQASAIVLLSSYSTVGTVAADGDSVKLPATFAIDTVMFIKNNGANSMDVFPASGDNLGEGVNIAVAVAAGESVQFIATVADSTWTQLIVAGAAFTHPDPHRLGNGTFGAPTYSFASLTNRGLFLDSGNLVSISTDGQDLTRWKFSATDFQGGRAGSGRVRNQTASSTLPTLIPNATDANTGIGWAANDSGSLIAGGLERLRFTDLTVAVEIFGAFAIPDGSAAIPSVAFTGDLNTGLYSQGADSLGVTVGGVARFEFNGNLFQSEVANGPALINEAPSATNPTLLPAQSDQDTGISISDEDELSLIAGGVECMRLVETNGTDVLISFKSDVNQTAHVGSSQGDGLLGGTYNHFSVVANAGDAATLPVSHIVGTQITIKNAGANSMDVFPNTGDTIEPSAQNAAVAVAAGATMTLMTIFLNDTWTILYNA